MSEDEGKICSIKKRSKLNYVIPIGIEPPPTDFNNKCYLRKKLEIDEKNFLIGYIGRIHQKKNIDSLIKAFILLNKEIKQSISLVIIGPGNSKYKKYISELVDSVDGDNIFLLDQIPHKKAIQCMSELDLYSLPSYTENFGMAITEALSVGTPVLISKHVNISKMVKKYNAGIIVKTDPKSISIAIKKLINKPATLESMKTNAKTLVRNKYSWDKIIIDYLNMYKKEA